VSVDRTQAGKPTAFFPDVIDLDAASTVHTYGAIGDQDLCSGPVDCHVHGGRLTFGLTFTISGDGKHPVDLQQYIVARGADVRIHDAFLIHWNARHRVGGVLRRTADQAGGAGVDARGVVAGANSGTTARGFSDGSIAIAAPGCDIAGAGVLTLTGGVHDPVLAVCPSDLVTDLAPHGTTWTATGAVAGASSYSTRLLVLRR
jgi:hypothetical protein